MIGIVDYGVGNLRSVQKALERMGGRVVITSEPRVLNACSGLVLPGVGAFGDAMRSIEERRLVEVLLRHVEAGKPILGVCLGMQLLFEESEEMGRHRGLGLFAGSVVRFPSSWPSPSCGGVRERYRVPHVGWNRLHLCRESRLLAGVAEGSYTYFVHSYYVQPQDEAVVLATTDYGLDYASVVGRNNVFGVQFHPEKSQESGLRMLGNFVRIVSESTEASEEGDDCLSGD